MKNTLTLFALLILCFLSINCRQAAQDIKEVQEVERADSFVITDQQKADSVEAYWKNKMKESSSEE